MTKADFISKIYAAAGLHSRSQTEAAVDAMLDCIREALIAGETVELRDFGSFRITERGARTGRNPRNGEEISIPACRAVKFMPGKKLKEAVK